MPCDPSSATYADNEKSAQSKSTYDRDNPQREGRIVNLSNMWFRDVTEIPPLHQEDSSYKYIDEEQTDDSIESNMIMNDDDDGKQNDLMDAGVTKAKITAMDRKIINAESKIALSFANVTSSLRESKTNDKKLAKMWGIGIDKAKKVVSTTTQRAVRNVVQPLSRQFRIRQSLF